MHLKKIIALFVLVFMVLGCSTKKNTFVSRSYHNITAHFNVYFNGNESFKSGARKVEEVNKDDYSKLLVVFPSSKKENLDGVSGEMDYAIEKGGKLITKHSITAKPNNSNYARKNKGRVEYNNWIDDGYLLVAKAQFYKKDYISCINTCNTIIRNYPETPSKYEAIIWMGRAFIETKQYADAQSILEGYDVSVGAPRSLLSFYMATQGDLNIRREQYVDAVPYIKAALAATSKKDLRIRYQYILAQLYQKTGSLSEAANAYENVIGMNPSYEIALNARVKRGSILLANTSSADMKKQLYKLLKSRKNKDFEGRIYYALAQISQSEKNDDEAYTNFRKSIDVSQDNQQQKNVSFLALGNFFYQKQEYKKAYLNYDSAFVNLDKESIEYEDLEQRHASLKSLVIQLDIVSREDSLQRIAKLSTAEQETFVNNMIIEKKQQEAALEKARVDAAQNAAQNEFDSSINTQSADNNTQGTGKWYFYNPAIIAQGRSDFARRWGQRKLEDNWRRNNKEAIMADPTTESYPGDPDSSPSSATKLKTVTDSTASSASSSAASRETKNAGDKILSNQDYLKGIPNSPEQIETSNKLIEAGLSQMSRIYENQLYNYPRAIETINELLRRFPKSNERSAYLMSSYQANVDNMNLEGAAKVKAQILKEFPSSEFAMYLTDPDYFKKLEQRKNEIDVIYQTCYSAYLANDFSSCITTAESTLASYPNNHLSDKFNFLLALSNAKTGNVSQFRTELNTIIADYPSSDCVPMSKEFLSQLDAGKTPIKVANLSQEKTVAKTGLSKEDVIPVESQYEFPDTTAMMVVVFISSNCDKNRVTYNIADYNFSRFIINDFELSSQTWSNKAILKIEPFENSEEAMSYFYALRENSELYNLPDCSPVVLVVISKANFSKLITGGDIESYNEFFKQSYLKRND